MRPRVLPLHIDNGYDILQAAPEERLLASPADGNDLTLCGGQSGISKVVEPNSKVSTPSHRSCIAS